MRTSTLRGLRDALEFIEDVFARVETSRKPSRFPGAIRAQRGVQGPWSMDLATAKETLKYLIGSVRMKFYLLSVVDGRPEALARVQAQPMDMTLRRALVDRMNTRLRWPVTLRGKRYDRRTLLSDPSLTFSQCRVHAIKDGPVPPEYVDFLKDLKNLPDGVFVLSLTDAVLARKDRGDPFGLGRRLRAPERLLPILNGSGHVDYFDIPIVNYDDLLAKPLGDDLTTTWNDKKDEAVFRGGSTGCGYTPKSNARLALAARGDVNLGVVSRHAAVKVDPVHGLGYQPDSKLVPWMSLAQQSLYKYIVHVDGNVAAFRLASMMRLKSLMLIVEGPYTLWYGHLLKPWKHYVPLKSDASDLDAKLEWCRAHDKACQDMAEAASQVAELVLQRQTQQVTFSKTLWSVV